ncbi:NAD(P)/FAD-dependent oxidoreductase [Nocardioides aestuarii]|uniref:NAD(P)/FAD-dependent oxidoreductase n=1 Tax=Nocardioides aestuarii TaxID=252231 RepID=A0ABW4TPH8_9ACTN
MTDELLESYDAIVVGGGAAGLNGALMLARSRRSVAVVDAGAPRNAPAEAVHGLLGHDGTSPADLLARGREEVRRYAGHVVDGEVTAAATRGDGFLVTLADGRRTTARRLLVTTGLVDELPDLPGLSGRWGRDVVHCPYCHGYEVRDRRIAVLGTGPASYHHALLFRQLSDDVVLVLHDAPEPDDTQARQLASLGVEVVRARATAVEVVDDAIRGLRLDDGSLHRCEVVAVATRMVARGGFLDHLGLTPVDHPSGMGVHVPADPAGVTGVPGVWAAGNVTDLTAQVGASAAAGALAGAHINADLVAAETAAAAGSVPTAHR